MGRARFDQGPLGWTMVGDFNEVLFPNERSRAGRLSNSMRRFSDIMNDLDLRDFLFREGPTLGEVVSTAAQCLVLTDF